MKPSSMLQRTNLTNVRYACCRTRERNGNKKKNLGYLTEARRMLMRVGLEPTPLS